jgi:allantoicase
MFFGPRHNLIMPGRAINMSGGWETKRRRGPGHDWVIVKLATEAVLRRLEIDTNHFKGNYPDTASVEGCRLATAHISDSDAEWMEVVPRTKLQAHTRHFYIDELGHRGPFTHLRLNVFPDGGVSRFRVHALATAEGVLEQTVVRINRLPDPRAELMACCGSTEWVERVTSARPFSDWNDLITRADEIWRELKPEAWMEAFRAHPRIGERKTSQRWAAAEQAATRNASDELIAAFDSANRDYEERFGHIFIVCASGKSSEEMLSMLRQRLGNEARQELEIAAEEQRKITHLRLKKLVTG